MKKISIFLIMIMVLILPFISTVNADEEKKVTVYIFRGEGCPHCEEALEFFDELDENEEYSKLYNLEKYEVWYDEDNAKLMEKVAEALNTEATGVPFIVIGDKFFSGFSSASVDEIKNTITEQYDNDSYKDVVKSVQNGSYKKLIEEKDNNAFIPIIIVSVVALLTIIGLVFFTKEK